MTDSSPQSFGRRQIYRRCEQALQRADVVGLFPTPLDEVIAASQLGTIIDISNLPEDIAATKPSLLKRLLGATVFPSRTVFVDLSQPEGRKRWTVAHEAVHGIMPWHEASARLDDEHRLFRGSHEELETEANVGAGYLIFQGNRWIQQALDYRHSLDVPIALSGEVGASIHATIRYYAEHHPDPMALLVTGRVRRHSGAVPVYLRVESPRWRKRFAPMSEMVAAELRISDTPLDELIRQARLAGDVARMDTRIGALTPLVHGSDEPVTVEVFDNQYNLFVLIRPGRRIELGRRIAARSLSA